MQTEAQTQQQKKFIQMTQTPVKRLIIKLAIPTMVSMMITSIYNMADTFFVGQISEGAGAATSATPAATATTASSSRAKHSARPR